MTQRKIIRAAYAALAAVSLSFLAMPPAQGQTQTQMNLSAGQNAAKADAAMNVAYRRLLAVLDAPQKTQLKQAQRAWLKFRDAEAALLSSKVKGGSVYPSVYSVHVREMTQERTQELKKAYLLFTTEGDM